MKLTALKASSARGIPRDWPTLDIGEKGLVVYGPNGVGKSSIIDCLEFSLTQRSSLFEENRQGVSWEQAAPHVRHGAPGISICVKDGNTARTLTPPALPEELTPAGQEWMSAAAACSFVLRRHMLLRFITQKPKDRYDLLAPFLNLASFSAVEGGLKEWSNSLESELNVKAADVRSAEATLRTILRVPAGTSVGFESGFVQLNELLLQLGKSQITDASQLEACQKELAEELGGTAQTERLAKLGSLRTAAQHLGRPVDSKPVLAGLVEAVEALEREVASRTEEVLTDLLITGRDAIRSAGLETCPLCEQPIDPPTLLDRLDARIAGDERISEARKLVAQRKTSLNGTITELTRGLANFCRDWEAANLTGLEASYTETITMLRELCAVLAGEQLTGEQLQDFPARFDAAISSHAPAIEALDALIDAEGGGNRRGLVTTALSMVEGLLNDQPALDRIRSEHERIATQRTVVDRIHGHAVEARKAAVQTTLDSVCEMANAYYELIHPGEGIATSTLAVRQTGQGSVNISSQFHGKEEHPLLHYSESHLDTLGLCYFLALRRHECARYPHFRVLVLDDVMHSVDAAHRARIASLLKTHFYDHQIVLCTHDEYFYDAVRRSFGNAGFRYVMLSEWDIEGGPRLSDPATDLDAIVVEEIRREKNRNDLSAAGGRFFEWLLKQLTEQLQVPVPARFARKHDIGNLWPPTASRLRKHEGFRAAHPGIVDTLDATVWVRNACGAHDNPTAAGVTLPEAREFAAALAALYKATWCEECDASIAKQRDGGWRCNCTRLSYSDKLRSAV